MKKLLAVLLSMAIVLTVIPTMTLTEAWAEDSNVTISYESANSAMGTVSPISESVAPATGEVCGFTASPAAGYRFVSWTDAQGQVVSTDAFFAPGKEAGLNVAATYTANFAPNTYYVHFNENGGNGTMVDEFFTYGIANYLTVNTYYKQDYLFTGWNTNADGTGTFYADGAFVENLSSTNDDSFTLYAQWASPSFKLINLKPTGTTGTDIMFYSELDTDNTGKKCANSISRDLTAVPAAQNDTDYVNTWTHTNQDNPSLVIDYAGIDTTSRQVIINYSGARYDESDTEDPSDWYLSAIIVKNDNIAYYGKIKKLSSKSDESCEGVIINIPEGVTLHPYDSNTIMYVFCENLSPEDKYLDIGGPLIAIGPYSVSYCDRDGEESNWSTTPLNYIGTGSTFDVGDGYSFSYGSEPGHYLRGWTLTKDGTTIDVEDGAKKYTMPGNNITFYAVWGTDHQAAIVYKSSNESMGTVSSAAESSLWSYAGVAEGSTATAKSGYHFVDWTDKYGREVSKKVEYTPNQTRDSEDCYYYADNTYTANFAADPVFPSYTADPVFPSYTCYMVKTSASPSEGGTVTGGGSYISGMKATLKASAKDGYTFLGWYGGGKPISTDASLEITVSADRDITAEFRLSSSTRIAGNTRYDTMSEAVKKAFPDGCATAILASGENWPDALSASSLAGVMDCPVVLTEPGHLTAQTEDLLSSLKVQKVIIVGGTVAVSDDVKLAVEAKNITTERIWGKNCTQTADKIARRVIDISSADTIIICSGQNFQDALSISSYAYAQKIPILLTGSNRKLSADSLAIAKNFSKAIIVGGKANVSLNVEKQLKAMKTARYAGMNHYETSIQLINNLFGGKATALAIATGQDYSDALAGAALAGKSGGAILLVKGSGTSVTNAQKAIIGNADKVWVLGGDNAVSDAMKAAIDNIIK
jgi:putative cell wall-binding protein